jgi:hypothetical protein
MYTGSDELTKIHPHTHKQDEHRSTQVRGSPREITPLLLHYDVYIDDDRATKGLLEL